MWRSVASNGLTLLIVLMIAAAGLVGWGQAQYRAEGPLEDAICLQVSRGSNMTRVADDLASDGAISNARLFRIGADYTEKSGALKAGSWLIPGGASMEEIADIVTRGGASSCGTEIVWRIGVNRTNVEVRELDPATNRFVELVEFDPSAEPDAEMQTVYQEIRDQQDTRFRIALAEGVTSWQVVEGLKAVDIMTGSVEEIPAEGYLAPDSYEVTSGDDRNALLALMQARQVERIDAAWRNRAEGLPLETKEELVILASIVEKETGVDEERPAVASVFENRLRQGMRLQTDPTVIYGVTGGQGVLGRGLRQSELRAETPYNTYVIDGLPPTPIANPGVAALEAAANPAETRYIFFVADGTGGHAFAETLDEHNANVARWRAIEAERNGQ